MFIYGRYTAQTFGTISKKRHHMPIQSHSKLTPLMFDLILIYIYIYIGAAYCSWKWIGYVI